MKIIFNEHPKRKREYSKVVLALIMLLFFAGAIYGGIVVWNTQQGLEALLTYIGAPTATAVAFYSWKAKSENVEKIKHSAESEENNDRLEEETDIA